MQLYHMPFETPRFQPSESPPMMKRAQARAEGMRRGISPNLAIRKSEDQETGVGGGIQVGGMRKRYCSGGRKDGSR